VLEFTALEAMFTVKR